MKITIERSALLDRLSHVAKAIGSKVYNPITEGILIVAAGAELSLTCVDTDLAIMTTLDDYEEHEAGAAVIPAKKLLEIIRKMPEKSISIEVDEAKATIKCGAVKVKLPAMNPEEFPSKVFAASDMTIIDGKQFTKLVNDTKFAVSDQEKTPILQGIFIQIQDEKITATATNRHRMAIQSISMTTDPANQHQFVVMTKPLELVTQLNTSQIEMHCSENELYIRSGDYQYIIRLLNGTYPETSRIIPTSFKTKVLIDVKPLLNALELAEKVNEEKTKIVRLDISEDELFISAKDENAGMEEALEAEVTGDPMIVSLNAKYLIDALKHTDGERVEISFTGPMQPITIRSESDAPGLNLVLPYRTMEG